MNKPEILAPAGGWAQLEAAVICGADAVYFGLPEFNARQSADNFTAEDIKKAVRYCHNAGVKVYITLNTLIKDEELEAMHKAVDTAARAGVDALIIQDLAVASYTKKAWPELPIHASTQMAVHNEAGVKILQECGFERIVLARELSGEEIKSIIANTGADTEVFVHGAHCMSVSGNCYMSSMFGARSGNRGLCAQPCRLDWAAGGRDHVLSLKDMSHIKHLTELAEAGVGSLKIEGRMKRPEYVAAAVTACKKSLAGEMVDETSLRAVFSRSGFTDGYYTAKRTQDMFGYRTKEDVVSAAEVLSNLEGLYKGHEPKRIPVSMQLSVKRGKPAELTVFCRDANADNRAISTSDDHGGGLESGKSASLLECTAFGQEPQEAIKLPLSFEQAEKSLSKTGSTCYQLSSLECDIEEGLMLPASALNALRRDALDALEELRHKPFEGRKKIECARPEDETLDVSKPMATKAPQLRLRFEKASQIFSGLETSEDIIILPYEEILAAPSLAEKYHGRLWAEIPALQYGKEGTESAAAEWAARLLKLGVMDAVCSNIGTLYLAKKAGFKIHGGAELNILNSDAMRELRALGSCDCCLSWELSFAKMKKIEHCLPFGFVAYGYIPLMKMRSCPGRGPKGCGKCEGRQKLIDRTGAEFTLLCRKKKYSELLNSVPIYTGDKSMPRAAFQILYFTIESAKQCERIYESFRAAESINSKKTMGLYQRELI